DNASTDQTAAVVDKLRDSRLSYQRHATNIGSSANWASLLDRAAGEYFVWLQDDDLIFPSFIAEGVTALQQNPDAGAYLAYATGTSDPDFMYKPWLYGPPVKMDWVTRDFTVFQGDFLTPISLFLSVAIPPVIVYRTSVLKECMPDFLN